MQLFKIWSYLCGRVVQRNIDVLSTEKKVGGRLDDLQTNGLDGLRVLAGSQVEEGMTSSYTGDVGIKEKHKRDDKLEITKGSIPKYHLTCKMKQKPFNNSSGNTKRIKFKEKFTVGRSAIKMSRTLMLRGREKDSIEWKILKMNKLFIHHPTKKWNYNWGSYDKNIIRVFKK